MSEEYRQTDHGRVIGSGAWIGAGVAVAGLGWADSHLPHLLGFAVNWSAVLTTCYLMARHKRAWYAWAAFWGMAVLCPVGGLLELLGLLRSQWSTASWVIGCAMVFVWYWLVRIPRLHPPKAADVQHVVYHHVVHGADGAVFPAGSDMPLGLDVTQLPEAVTPGQRAAVPGRVLRAIEAPKMRPASWRATVREAIRRDRP